MVGYSFTRLKGCVSRQVERFIVCRVSTSHARELEGEDGFLRASR